jgi:cytochrome c peroxidase
MKRLLFAVLVLSVGACDSSSSVELDDMELNDQLEQLITLNGQRRLANFVLPESDDFESIPQDPRNPLTSEKVLLGQILFHEPGISQKALHPMGKGTFSCASCHHAKAGFAAGRQQSIGDGGSGWGTQGELRTASSAYTLEEVDAPPLRSPSILNAAFQRVMLWSGAAGSAGPNNNTEAFWLNSGESRVNHLGYDGVETQAILALNTHRMDDLSSTLVASNTTYLDLWNRVYPGQPISDELAGLAIAAFERTVLANKAPFQRWLKGETGALTSAQKRGALVFFGPSRCSDCHTGPALNSMAFYALGMPDLSGAGVIRPPSESKGRGDFLTNNQADYKFKVPQLYNMSDAPFLGHGGTFKSVAEVIDYYVAAVPDRFLPAGTLTGQFQPLTLTNAEIRDLNSFLNDALKDPDLMRYQPKSVPSGGCIPANDIQSRLDLGCN